MVTVVNSTFVSNSCAGGNGAFAAPAGNRRGVDGNGGDGSGGAVDNNGVTVDLINATLSSNGCTGGTGIPTGIVWAGIFETVPGWRRLKNTIVANSSSGTNAFGTITDGGNNLSSDLSCNFTNVGSLNNTNPVGPIGRQRRPHVDNGLAAKQPGD